LHGVTFCKILGTMPVWLFFTRFRTPPSKNFWKISRNNIKVNLTIKLILYWSSFVKYFPNFRQQLIKLSVDKLKYESKEDVHTVCGANLGKSWIDHIISRRKDIQYVTAVKIIEVATNTSDHKAL
jgi:hypothetical protein